MTKIIVISVGIIQLCLIALDWSNNRLMEINSTLYLATLFCSIYLWSSIGKEAK